MLSSNLIVKQKADSVVEEVNAGNGSQTFSGYRIIFSFFLFLSLAISLPVFSHVFSSALGW